MDVKDGRGKHNGDYDKDLVVGKGCNINNRTLDNLHSYLKASESFCVEVGMNVNMNKTKIVVFSLKK
jgi:hypothetical protein